MPARVSLRYPHHSAQATTFFFFAPSDRWGHVRHRIGCQPSRSGDWCIAKDFDHFDGVFDSAFGHGATVTGLDGSISTAATESVGTDAMVTEFDGTLSTAATESGGTDAIVTDLDGSFPTAATESGGTNASVTDLTVRPPLQPRSQVVPMQL